ncbi:hypothetical protein BDP81DRAFT_137260 [Colletotrichum phormii]|uniref:Uncharacterized protein n=1 Tax=Colletotrichum phormii TaxID=359342 RepID=A0AAJ0EB24_9PEZI|nr:uncharacterized protein BDP81DRAFT_137260 [Colletotrichum phormii]KAK1623283.1 hypothetical protein BDP81DRAFT_137260 [Colletotrichum phormii]
MAMLKWNELHEQYPSSESFLRRKGCNVSSFHCVCYWNMLLAVSCVSPWKVKFRHRSFLISLQASRNNVRNPRHGQTHFCRHTCSVCLASDPGITSEEDAAADFSRKPASTVVCKILLLNIGAPESNILCRTSKLTACRSFRSVIKRPCMALVEFWSLFRVRAKRCLMCKAIRTG